MAHIVSQSAYQRLTERLNRFPQGAPPTELLTKILKVLFDQREAELVSLLPIRPFTVKRAADVWRMSESQAHKILDGLAEKALLVDFYVDGDMHYVLPPPMAGFFEFSMMRIREDIDQRLLAELFYQYLNVEEDFVRALFTEGQTQLGRAFVHEPALSEANALHVLDYERASEVVTQCHPPGHQHVLLPAQDGPHGPGLHGAHGHLHDLQHLGRIVDPSWPRAVGGRFRMSGAAGKGP